MSVIMFQNLGENYVQVILSIPGFFSEKNSGIPTEPHIAKYQLEINLILGFAYDRPTGRWPPATAQTISKVFECVKCSGIPPVIKQGLRNSHPRTWELAAPTIAVCPDFGLGCLSLTPRLARYA